MIEINDLQKVLDGRTELDIPALSVKPGQVQAVVGPLGSGGEILLSLLLGQTRPTLGQIRIKNIDPFTSREEFTHLAGILFEEDGLYERQSVLGNLLFFCKIHGLPRRRAEIILENVGLADHASLQTGKLTPGLKRRLAFGRIFLHNPEVYFVVDPFARCDQASISLLSNLIRQNASEGSTWLLFSDDASSLSGICEKIHILEQGRIKESFHPGEEISQTFLPFKIPVRLEGRVILLNPADILYADVQDGKAYLHTIENVFPSQFTLSELEERLQRSGFFRAHRSYLVNLQHVKEVIPYTRDSFSLRLDDITSTEIPLSKSSASDLKELLGY